MILRRVVSADSKISGEKIPSNEAWSSFTVNKLTSSQSVDSHLYSNHKRCRGIAEQCGDVGSLVNTEDVYYLPASDLLHQIHHLNEEYQILQVDLVRQQAGLLAVREQLNYLQQQTQMLSQKLFDLRGLAQKRRQERAALKENASLDAGETSNEMSRDFPTKARQRWGLVRLLWRMTITK